MQITTNYYTHKYSFFAFVYWTLLFTNYIFANTVTAALSDK